jgi:hypothetical protein
VVPCIVEYSVDGRRREYAPLLRVVEQRLRAHSSGSSPSAHIDAVAFIHRFGSTPNTDLHFHCIVIDGVFDSAAAGAVLFHAATARPPPPLLRCIRTLLTATRYRHRSCDGSRDNTARTRRCARRPA